jgi:hypothetical protein
VAGFDDQMWPINCAILVLAGFVAGIVLAQSDLHDARPLYNGVVQLGVVAAMVVLAMIVAYGLQGKIRRRLQFCILLSLLVHLSGALYVYCHPLMLEIVAQSSGGGLSIPVDEDLVAPDYHWVQAEEPDADQAFESPLATVVQDEMPPAAAVEPPDWAPSEARSRDVPVSDIPRSAGAEETPLGSLPAGAAVAMPSAPVVASREVQSLAGLTLAMNRQALRAVEMPNSQGEAPALPAAPKQPPVEPQAAAAATEKAPSEAKAVAAAPPLSEPGQSRAVARLRPEPGQTLPALPLMARLPSAGTGEASRGGGRETQPSSQSTTLVRADVGGQNLPSSVLPNQGETSITPAAAGGSPGSRLEITSTVAVERTSRSRAPAGRTVAAAGTRDLGTGSGLLLARSGVPGGKGSGRPSIAGRWGEEEEALRAGAPGSLSDRGAPLPVAAARRANASQPGGGGTSLAPGLSATLPRTQRPGAADLPSAVLPSEEPNIAGAGGVSAGLGGGSSNLQSGSFASVGRAGGTGTGQARTAGPPGFAGYPGPLDFGAGSSSVAGLPGMVGGGPRGVALPTAGMPSDERRPSAGEPAMAGGFARAAGATRLPGGAAEFTLTLPAVSPAKTGQPAQTIDTAAGRSLAELAMATSGPADVLVIGRRGVGPPTVGGEDAAGTDAGAGPRWLGPANAAGRRGRSDIDPNELAGGRAPVAVARSGGPLTLEGTVKEPTQFYRHRGDIRHGLGPGDVEGSGFTEPAVEFGLGFFTRLQFPDGHWSFDRLPEGVQAEDAALGQLPADSAATGLVLLSYLGAGYTHLDEKYRDVVRRGLDWLVKHQKPDGDLFTGGHRVTHFYGHGIAAMALCEVYGMTQDPELREPARKAVEYIVKTQDPRHGGWRYEAGMEESDTSVTGWQLMALKSAQMAGLEVPQETLDKIRRWLDQSQGSDSDGRYVYSPWKGDTAEEREGRSPSLAMTAEAMLMRMYLGQRRDNAQLIRGAEYLAANLPEVGSSQKPTRNCYYWYYATQAMYQMQGPFWTAWQGRLNPLLKTGQVQDGPLAGSWHPLEPVRDVYGNAGRLYVTAMNLLMLEVSYRHLPLFQELSK